MQLRVILTSFTLAAWLLLPNTVFARNPAPSASGDEAMLEMSRAFKKGDRKRLSALLPKAKGHLLEPWADYWELYLRLQDASSEEIQAFLQRHAGSYQEDRLRNDWLLLLGKNRDWGTFMAEYPKYRMGDDRSVRCFELLTQGLSSGAEVADQVQELWLSLRELDEGCAAAAQQQLENGQLKPHAVWLRARLAFENGRPQVAHQAISLLDAKWAATAATIYASPVRYLDDRITALRQRSKELVTLALIRLATTDYEAAALELSKIRWRTQLTQEERSWVWGVIGKRAAWKLSSGTLNHFAHGQDQQMHADHLLWKARAALRAGAWSEVLNAVNAMPAVLRNEPTWVYWRARAMLATPGDPQAPAQARALLESIASPRGFYEQLALEELGRPITVPPRPLPPTAAELEAARSHPGLRRALYAIQIGLRAEGVREWNYTTNLHQKGGMNDRELLAAAALACERQVWDRCINTSERTRSFIDFEQRFPMPLKSEVLQRTSQIELDPAYVYGLIRQESRFILDAKSSVGASGLMQVMPATARWTAKRIGLNSFKPHHINERETNIAIGTGYLKLVLENFDGSLPLAAAAYNAGPSRARNWRGQDGDPVLEAAVWAENIPFSETRDYVKKVLSNTTNYAALITGKPQSLKSRLGKIGPSRPGSAALDEDLP